MLGAGLAAVGEAEPVGSTGAVLVWGEGSEEEPGDAPLTLFCRGERGL